MSEIGLVFLLFAFRVGILSCVRARGFGWGSPQNVACDYFSPQLNSLNQITILLH